MIIIFDFMQLFYLNMLYLSQISHLYHFVLDASDPHEIQINKT